MKEFGTQFNAITPETPESGERKGENLATLESTDKPIERELIPLQETEESISFLGVEVSKGNGGPNTPPVERFKKDVITNFDHKIMRDIAVAFRVRQPIMLQGGSGIGKSRTVDRMCGLLNKEVYYADCHQFDADTLIGKMAPSEETKTGFGWRDGVVIQAIRNGGILFLDEYNFMSGEVRASLHEILDAILQGKNQITLVDNHGERVAVHKDFQIVAAQNPPGGEHGNREVLDPAQYTRFSHLNLPEDLPAEVKKARALGRFGFDNKITLGQSEYLFSGGISQEALAEVPGLEILIEKYIEFSESLEKVIEAGDLKDGPQPTYFAFQRDYDRVISFVREFYRGDINETFTQALRNNYVNRFIDTANREKVEEMIRHVRYEAPQDNRRKGLDREKKPEVGMSPEDLERREKVAEMLAKSDKELSGLETSLRKAKKEVLGESFETKISTIYTYEDEGGKDIVENIRIDFEQKLAVAVKFYKEHDIYLTDDFASEMREIWAQNIDQMREQIEKFGFDEILLIPGGLKITEALDKELTVGYKKKDGSEGDPTYWEMSKEDIVSDKRSHHNRIVLVHKNKARDLKEATGILPILRETLGKKASDFKPEEGMTIEEYYIFQRADFEETGNHLDGGDGVTWLPGSTVGSRGVRACFSPERGRVCVGAYDADRSASDLGCRPARCFFKR